MNIEELKIELQDRIKRLDKRIKRSGKMKNRKNEMVWNKDLGIYVLPKVEEKGLKDVLVFQVCECDSVAAYSCEEAVEWYKEFTGLDDDNLYSYDDIEIVPFDMEVWDDEDETKKITIREIVNKYWNGEPFIVTTTV